VTGFAQVEREELLPLSVAVDVQRIRDAKTWEKYASQAEKPRTEPWAKVTTMLIGDIQSGKDRDEGFVPTMTDVPYHQHEPRDVLGLAGTVEIGGRVSYDTTSHELRQTISAVELVGGVINLWTDSDELITTAEPCL